MYVFLPEAAVLVDTQGNPKYCMVPRKKLRQK